MILANCMQIISNFTNPRFLWKQEIISGFYVLGYDSLIGSIATVDSDYDTIFNESKNLAAKLGILSILKGT